MNKKLTQLRWLAAMLMLVAAMVMPSVAWAQDVTYTNGFGSDGSYQEATLTTDTYDIDGNGTKDKVYEIENAGQLYWFADKVNNDNTNFGSANAILTTSITVNSSLIENLDADGIVKDGYVVRSWTPIGDNINYVGYSGTFDGNGNSISGLYYNGVCNVRTFFGLFGRTSGTIKNIGVKNSCFLLNLNQAVCYIGGVCGLNVGPIENCFNEGTITITGTGGEIAGVGGISGSGGGTIKNSHNKGKVTITASGTIYVGGVKGINPAETIESCFNIGEISGINNVGGVCGYNYAASHSPTIKNCYNTGKVSGTKIVGGVCGQNSSLYGYIAEITNCYNTGAVSGESSVGGVCGYIYVTHDNIPKIENCYYLSGKAEGGIGSSDKAGSAEVKTTEQFANGEVCYLLNNGMTDGSQAWYQTLSGEGYPNLNKDAENRTVYGAYKHGETSPTCSNSQSSLSMLHAHAYDSSTIDEISGNHDMSYVQNGQNPYTWEDINNYSNATAQCNFKCSVCNSEVAKDMTVTSDGDKTNKPAKCSEKGHNYYVASLTFNGTTYTKDYTQEVPVLGHDKSGYVTFNSGKSIYEKVCKRDGCNEVLDYYATSNGSVKATYEDGVYKVTNLCMKDGLAYDSKAEFTVTSLAYKRTFSHDKWVAVYVPFEINCDNLANDFEMAVVNNFHEYEQTDGSYNVVLEVKRMTSGTIPALTPCVMRLKTEPASATEKEIQLSNVPFSAAADNYIDCSSVTRYYKFTGSLAGKAANSLNGETDFVLNEGTLHKANTETTLKAQRWYLTATGRNGSSTSATMLRSITLRVIGDSEGDVTGIEDVHVVTEKATSARDGIFDLQGRRLNSEPTNGIYIKNGVKYVK